MKLLIFIPSPRNDPEFEDLMAKLPHDKFWIKYHPYSLHPYQKAREFFLKHKEYTHFAICPDDLMATVEGVKKLWKHAQKLKVIMGTCAVEPNDDRLAMTHNLPSGNRDGRVYEFYTEDEINGKLITVPWCGTPFAIFQRSVIEKIEFDGDGKWNPHRTAFSYDVGMAHDLKDLKIKIHVDTSVFFVHKRHQFPILNGKEEPTWWWDKDGHPRIVDPEAMWNSLDKKMAVFKANNGFSQVPANEAFFLMYDLIKMLGKQNK